MRTPKKPRLQDSPTKVLVAVVAFLAAGLASAQNTAQPKESIPTSAQGIDIEGLHVGMAKADVQERFPTWSGFTIAGVSGTYTPVSVDYRDEILDQLLFTFNANSFATIVAAVKEKYPAMTCETTRLGNAIGATFDQVSCSLRDSVSVLRLVRYVDISLLSLESKRLIEERELRNKKSKKDI